MKNFLNKSFSELSSSSGSIVVHKQDNEAEKQAGPLRLDSANLHEEYIVVNEEDIVQGEEIQVGHTSKPEVGS